MKAWRVGNGVTAPVAVEVEALRPLLTDADGHTIYKNTHFACEAEAWDYLLRDMAAGEFLSLRALEEVERELERRRSQLVEASRAAITAREAHKAWRESQGGGG